MTKATNKTITERGNEAAARFLQQQGYEILERDWQCFAGKVDIIAKDDDAVVFIEVKTRSGKQSGFPTERVDAAKRERFEKIALAYLADRNFGEARIRFDNVAVVIQGSHGIVRHHVNAFAAA